MQDEQEQRYARWQQQAEDEERIDPLEEVRAMRAAQLAVCDLHKQEQLARLHAEAEQRKEQKP